VAFDKSNRRNFHTYLHQAVTKQWLWVRSKRKRRRPVASDVVKLQGEDPDTEGGTGRGWDVGDLGSWVRLPWLAHDEAPGPYITIPQYRSGGGCRLV